MSHPATLQEPELSPAARRVLAALLLSLGLHAAIIGLVRIVPAKVAMGVPAVMQVRFTQPAPVQTIHPVTSVVALSQPVLQATVPSSTSVPVAPSPQVAAAPVSITETGQQAVAPVAAIAPLSPDKLPQIDLPLNVDTTYYTAKEVDVHPRALLNIQPIYPAAAAANNQQGWVVLRIKLDETGKVEEVKVVDATPAGVFDESALEAFRQGKFAPAQKSGRAVKSLMEIKVWFKLE
ncbi:MAG: TonB family protein [Sulfuriferula sp.]